MSETKLEHPELTFGQKRVGTNFNPSEHPHVKLLKEQAASFIDNVKALQDISTDAQQKRAYALAITAMQEAQMWAVKGIFEKE